MALPGAFLALIGGYLVALAAASLGYRSRPASEGEQPSSRLTVVVPAHDEELLVARCVASLLAQDYPRDLFQVVVVADNCTDATASVARAAGATVDVRDEPDARGKGRALRWAMDRLLARPDAPDAFVVVDADSVADARLLSALAAELEAGHDVVQADYSLLDESRAAGTDVTGIGFLLFHRVRFKGRAQLGMAANLVGNGMLLSRGVLQAHPWDAFTGVEDLEYSIGLRMAGIKPRFAPGARVAGPGPASAEGARRQRMRWEGGRFYVVRRWLPRLLMAAVVRRQAGLLDAAIDLATPPVGALCLAIVAGGLLTTGAAVAGVSPWWSVVPWALAAAAVPVYVVVGLWSAGVPPATWRALVHAPSFLAWKLTTYLHLVRRGHDVTRWDRTDRVVP